MALAAALAVPLGAHAASAAAMTSMPACSAGDPVVWVNTKSKVFHMQGDSYYGKTKTGKYACKSAAVAMGAHASHHMSGMMKGSKHMRSTMKGCDTSGMSMASPMPGKRHHNKKKNSMKKSMMSPAPAEMTTSPNPLVPAPSPTPTT